MKLINWCHKFWNDARLYERIVFIIGSCFLLLWCGYEYSSARNSPPLFVQAPDTPKVIRVHIKGAVYKPSLITLPVGARLNNAIQKAGGITKNANARSLNLAAPLRDGQEIVVPSLAGKTAKKIPQQVSSHSDVLSVKSQASERLINVNTASVQELEVLPGIGPAIAARIVTEREKRPFTSLQELDRVKGIGPMKLQKMAAYVTF